MSGPTPTKKVKHGNFSLLEMEVFYEVANRKKTDISSKDKQLRNDAFKAVTEAVNDVGGQNRTAANIETKYFNHKSLVKLKIKALKDKNGKVMRQDLTKSEVWCAELHEMTSFDETPPAPPRPAAQTPAAGPSAGPPTTAGPSTAQPAQPLAAVAGPSNATSAAPRAAPSGDDQAHGAATASALKSLQNSIDSYKAETTAHIAVLEDKVAELTRAMNRRGSTVDRQVQTSPAVDSPETKGTQYDIHDCPTATVEGQQSRPEVQEEREGGSQLVKVTPPAPDAEETTEGVGGHQPDQDEPASSDAEVMTEEVGGHQPDQGTPAAPEAEAATEAVVGHQPDQDEPASSDAEAATEAVGGHQLDQDEPASSDAEVMTEEVGGHQTDQDTPAAPEAEAATEAVGGHQLDQDEPASSDAEEMTEEEGGSQSDEEMLSESVPEAQKEGEGGPDGQAVSTEPYAQSKLCTKVTTKVARRAARKEKKKKEKKPRQTKHTM